MSAQSPSQIPSIHHTVPKNIRDILEPLKKNIELLTSGQPQATQFRRKIFGGWYKELVQGPGGDEVISEVIKGFGLSTTASIEIQKELDTAKKRFQGIAQQVINNGQEFQKLLESVNVFISDGYKRSDDLFTIYGDTASAAQSASDAIIAKAAAELAAGNAQVESTNASVSAAAAQTAAEGGAAVDSAPLAKWGFNADLDGWTTTNSVLTWNAIGYAENDAGIDQTLISPVVSVLGSDYFEVVARFRRVNGVDWTGRVRYSTAAHTFTSGFEKTIPEPTNYVTGEWVTCVWKMKALTVGGTDWLDNTITGIQLLLGTPGGTSDFEVDWITIGNSVDTLVELAATSANAAATSETTAAGYVTNAEAAATAAETSKLNAAASETNSANSATASNTSAGVASGFADAAGASASAADVSKLAAETASSDASASATAASSSAASASSDAVIATDAKNVAVQYSENLGGSTNQIFSNPEFKILDSVGRPSGVYAHYTNSDPTIIKWNEAEQALEISSTTDSDIGGVLTAVPVNPGTKYLLKFRVRSDVAASSGFYFRIAELDTELSDGFNAVGTSNLPNESNVQVGTRQRINLFSGSENAPITISYVDFEYEYTPTSTAKWFSPFFLNWTGIGLNKLFVKHLRMMSLADVTATSSAHTALDARVTTAEGDISAQASQISTIQTEVDNNTASVTTLSFSVNGIEAKHGVSLDVNGYITGYIQNNNGVSGDFIIIADKFAVVTPGGTPIVPFLVSGVTTYMQNVVIQDALIENLTVGKLTTGTLNADVNMGSGRIVFDNGTYVKMQGVGFGSISQFIEWFGPKVAEASMTELNAISYIKTDGSAYFGGSLSAGTLTTSGSTTDLSSTAQIKIGPSGSNGGSITVTLSYSYQKRVTSLNEYSANTDPNKPKATIELYQKIGAAAETLVGTYSWIGGEAIFNSGGEPGIKSGHNQFISGSVTFTDNGLVASDRTYRAVLILRSLIPAAGTIASESQKITLIAVEE